MNTRINILQWILTKLGTYLVLKRIWNPIDFQVHRVKYLGEGICHALHCPCFFCPCRISISFDGYCFVYPCRISVSFDGYCFVWHCRISSSFGGYCLFDLVGHHYPLLDIVISPCRISLSFGRYCFCLSL